MTVFMMKKMMKKMPKMMEKCMDGMNPEDMEKMKEEMHGKMEGCISTTKAEHGDAMIGMCSKMFEQANQKS